MTEPCPICKSPDTRVTYPLTGYRIAQCRRCQFEFNDGFAAGGGDNEMFSADYYTKLHEKAFREQFDDYQRDPSANVYARWLDRIAAHSGAGRILDVGSALGAFLKIAADKGFTPQGVEISQFAADFARQKRGLEVFTGDLEQFPGKDGSFDVITFWDSIEHVTHPLENLRTATRLLRRGGLLLLTTDNFDCLIADIARLLYRMTSGRSRYAMQRVFIAPNRSFFTAATLRALLEACSLRVVMFEKMDYPLDKIRTNLAERVLLRGLYGAALVLNRQAQVTVVAEKV